jgi:SNF2 family DNA or RNA helicase
MFSASRYLRNVFADVIRESIDLHDYQREAVDWLYDKPMSALFLDVGLGKTPIILTLLDRLFTEGFDGKVLIIAPIRVAARVWMQEHRLWGHLAYFRPTLIRDPKPIRRKTLLDDPAQIHVINQEAVAWLVNQYPDTNSWPYQVVIFDESSRLRNHTSVVFKKLKSVLSQIERFHQLTATPASQTYMHLFSQIYLLDRGQRFGKFISRFRDAYFDYNRYTFTYTLRQGGAQAIEKKISDICFVLKGKRDFIINTHAIVLPDMRQYDKFVRTFLLEIPEDQIIEAINGAALSSKLLQLSSGAVYDEVRRYHVVHDEKIDELRDIIEQNNGEPVLVAYWFKSSLDRLKKAFPTAVVMDREGKIEGPWNRREIPILLAHPQSVGHGLNLQAGGHQLVVFDAFWSLELFTQLIGRLDRQGQTRTVVVHLLSCVGTLDEVVTSKLQHLDNAQDAMFRRLRELHRQIRRATV